MGASEIDFSTAGGGGIGVIFLEATAFFVGRVESSVLSSDALNFAGLAALFPSGFARDDVCLDTVEVPPGFWASACFFRLMGGIAL